MYGDSAFHGFTTGSWSVIGSAVCRRGFDPLLPDVPIPLGDLDALAAELRKGDVAALIIEPIQGKGVQVPPPGFLSAATTVLHDNGALLICDEVQTGLGRTGKWFGYQHAEGVRPDIVTMAKALGNGVPIGACWARAEVAAAFRPGDHATTFGGQPLAARAAMTVLDVMAEVDAPACAARAGEVLTKALLDVPGVVDVRGVGLLIAAELAVGIEAAPVANACLDAGLVVNAVTPTALRFAPSLLVTDDEIAAAVAILTQVLSS